MRVLDPSGVTIEWLKNKFPDATIDREPDEQGPYDAAMLYGDLDNRCDPAKRLAAVASHVRRPGGRVYVSLPEALIDGKRTAGRRRAWRSVEVADLLRRYGRLDEFAIDDDGFISAAMEPFGKKKEIAIWTGFAIGPWHPMDILTRGLGGSETAAYRMAEVLAEMGYIVTLYGHFRQMGAQKDVILKDWQSFDPTRDWHAVIAFRNAEMFEIPVNAKCKILWLEDVAGAEALTEKRAENLDYVVGVSEWHRQNVLEKYPWLSPEKAIASRNGITHEFFDGDAPEREPRVLFTSSPDRGLDIVLECWPRIKEQVPDAELYHMYGPWYDLVANRAPAITAHRERIRKLSEQDGVKAVGSLGQENLAMLMRSSMVWCHPSYFSVGKEVFTETSCISAMEAQAAGLAIVCSTAGALNETVKVGVKIDGDPMTPEWRTVFVEHIVAGLTNREVQEQAQKDGPLAVGYNDWYGVAIQLEKLWSNKGMAGADIGTLMAGVAAV